MAATTTSKYVVSMGGNGEQCSQNDLRHASSASSKIRQVTPGTKIRQVMDLSLVHKSIMMKDMRASQLRRKSNVRTDTALGVSVEL